MVSIVLATSPLLQNKGWTVLSGNKCPPFKTVIPQLGRYITFVHCLFEVTTKFIDLTFRRVLFMYVLFNCGEPCSCPLAHIDFMLLLSNNSPARSATIQFVTPWHLKTSFNTSQASERFILTHTRPCAFDRIEQFFAYITSTYIHLFRCLYRSCSDDSFIRRVNSTLVKGQCANKYWQSASISSITDFIAATASGDGSPFTL